MNESEVTPIVGAVIALLGGGVAALGIGLAIVGRGRRRRGSRATGVVVDNVYGYGHALAGQSILPPPPAIEVGPIRIEPKPREMAYPLVEFKTAAGVTTRFRSSYGGYAPVYKVGTSVSVYYDARDPQKAGIVGEGRCLAIFLIAFGLFVAAIGAGIWLLTRGA
jgi:hypothetical protein